MPSSLNDSITDKVTGESKTKYDNEAAQVKALEKTLGRKRVLYKDFQFFVTQLSKKENLKRLQDDIAKAEQGSKIREQKEKELQVALERIQKNAYEAAAKRYENLVEHSTSVYAQEMGRVYIQQEKNRQEEIENTFRQQLMQIKQLEEGGRISKEEEKKQTQDAIELRGKLLSESLTLQSKTQDELDKKEKDRTNIFIKSVESKVKQRQKLAQIEQETLDRYIEEYKDLKESDASEDVLAAKSAQIQAQKNAVSDANMKAEVTKAMGEAVSQAVNKMGSAIADALHAAEDVMVNYNASITSRLQGSGKDFKGIMDMTVKNTAMSPFVQTTKVLETVKKASEEGIAYNIELRSFLGTISDKVAATFDAFDSSLLRIVRLQQADSTAARLGMEASLTKLFNSMFNDTSYLAQDIGKSVSAAIIDANSQLNQKDSAEFEYVVQKWLGSLSSLGMSTNAISNIATGINYLATGNVQALAGNNQLQTLFAMAASKGGTSYADLLLNGLDAKKTNELLENMVSYLKEIAEGSANKVVRGAYGDIFNLTASDFKSIQNLTNSDISTIASSMLTYEGMNNELSNQFTQLLSRTTISEMLSNIANNSMFNLGTNLYKNPASYAMLKMLDGMDALGLDINIPFINAFGTGLDLNTSVNNLMRLGIGLSSTMSLVGTIFNALGSIGAAGGLDLASWEGKELNTRGSSISGLIGTLVGGKSSSTYVGTGSSSDIKKSALSSATDDAEESGKITNKNNKAEKTFDDFYKATIGDEAKSYVRTREIFLSQALDDGSKWIRVYDATISASLSTIFGTSSFFQKTIKVSDDAFNKYSEGNAIRVVDSGLFGVTSALMEVRNATKAQATAKASVQKVTIDEESVKRAILNAIANSTNKDVASLQDVIDIINNGQLVVKIVPDTTNPTFDVNLKSVSPLVSFNVRR